MSKFVIGPHMRLQEWVAEEKGYFKEEGLDYEFIPSTGFSQLSVKSATELPKDQIKGAYQTIEQGRSCDISAACHWAVNMAASGQHGKMWGHAYSVTPAGIYVAAESSIRRPEDLKGREVGVGYHSGSHFSALQALEAFLQPDEINLKFIGSPNDRVAQLLDRRVESANVFGLQSYIVEQQGFRKVVDASFMIGFLISREDVAMSHVEKYFNALRRAQRQVLRLHDADLQLQPALFGLQARAHRGGLLGGGFGVGGRFRGFLLERIVFEPYTREVYEQTHRWMKKFDLFPAGQTAEADYRTAVLV